MVAVYQLLAVIFHLLCAPAQVPTVVIIVKYLIPVYWVLAITKESVSSVMNQSLLAIVVNVPGVIRAWIVKFPYLLVNYSCLVKMEVPALTQIQATCAGVHFHLLEKTALKVCMCWISFFHSLLLPPTELCNVTSTWITMIVWVVWQMIDYILVLNPMLHYLFHFMVRSLWHAPPAHVARNN